MNFYQKVFGHHHSDPIRSIDDQLLTIRSFGKVLPVLTGKVHGVLIVCNIFSESLLTPSLQISVNTRTSNTEGLPCVQLVLSLPKASIIPVLTHSFFHNCRNLLKIIGITISLHHSPFSFLSPKHSQLSLSSSPFSLIVVMHITYSWRYIFNLLNLYNVVCIHMISDMTDYQELDNQITCSSLGKNGCSSS